MKTAEEQLVEDITAMITAGVPSSVLSLVGISAKDIAISIAMLSKNYVEAKLKEADDVGSGDDSGA